MPRSIIVAVAGLVLAQCVVAVRVEAARPIYVPNEYIIRAQAGSSVSLVEQAVARMGATLARALPLDDTYLIRMGQAVSQRSLAVKSYGASAQPVRWVIESIQPNYLYQYDAVPNDEYWSKQWDMRQMSMPGAWEIEKGSSTVIAAIVDSGVANHPDLVNRIIAGYDFIDGDNDPSNDVVGHGTHVAGTVGAQGNNAFGICGVCWNSVKIMPLKIGDNYGLPEDAILGGLDYALTHGADVVNMSWGGPGDDPVLHAKLAEMAGSGMVLCAAAGNDGDTTPNYPAAYAEVISVASVGPYDAIAPYSSFGKVDIAAPGGDSSLGPDATIWSTMVSFDGQGRPTYFYGGMEGTSMASPHVTGAAALLMSHGIPASDVRNRLMTGARSPKTGSMDPIKYGAGIADLQASLANAVMRISKPGKGATVGTGPDFQVVIQGISTTTAKIYVDYADLNDDGVPDDPSEGIVMAGTTISPDIPTIYSYMNASRTAIEFNWSDLPNAAPMTAGAHNVYVTADAAAGGGSVSDWAVFNVARRKISRGIHLFAFPYALANRATDTPSKILPGALFGLGASQRSTLWRWLAAPRSSVDATPIGYDTYSPSNSGERVWSNPFAILSGSSVPTGGGYYYDSVARKQQFAFPAGSGFWLILPADFWIDESYATLESLPSFDGSKGFDIPLYKGWNMIGTPYAHEVPWRAALFTYRGRTMTLLDAESAGWVRSTIYTYGTAGTSGYVRVTDRDMLEPYRGYWLVALTGGASASDSLVLNILP